MEEGIKSFIAEWLTSPLPNIIERDLSLPLDKDYIITVTGGRRSGKTFLLYQTIKKIIEGGLASRDEILYVDFDDYRLKNVTVNDLDKIILSFEELTGKTPKYIFFDEIQDVKDYGSWFRKKLNARIFLSGSSSQLTPLNIANELRGRSVNYEVYPLSFKEFLRFKGFIYNPLMDYTLQRGKILSLLREYLQFGSYPAVVLEEDKVRLLRSYFDSVIVRDLSIVKPSIAETFASFLIANYSNPITVNRVYNYIKGLGIKIGKDTILELFSKAKETYFSFLVEEFEKSESKRRANPKKLYIIDTGYPTALGYEFSISRAMENAVYIELLRRGYKEVFYWKGKRREVDFVVSKNFEPKILIQVTYATDKIEEREIEGLKEASSSLKAEEGIIITWDYEGKVNGFKAIPLWKWLLHSS
jgi:hypothetical protein